MDRDTQSLTRQLFAQATMILERAHEVSVRGQATRLTADAGVRRARELRSAALSVAKLTEAAEVVIGTRIKDRGR